MKTTNKILIIVIIILILLLIISISISIVNSNKNIVQPEPTTVSYNPNIVEIETIQDKKENEILVAILDKNKDDNVIVIGADGENVGNENNVVENNTSPYYIKINVQTNTITIYKKDGNGNYNIPLKTMLCSCGMTTQTEGTYSLKKYNNWQWKTVDNKLYAQYATQISGDILFHSMPYTVKGDKSSLVYEEYDKLGTYTSSKSILLTVADAKWIYENCPPETQVTFYISDTASPLSVTKSQLITEDVDVRGWDPTDPDENNPWKTYVRPERPQETNNQENNNENQNTNTTQNNTQQNNNNVGAPFAGIPVRDDTTVPETNNTIQDNTIGNNTTTNNVSENNNTVENNIQNNQTNNNTVVENRVLEQNNDVTIKSEIIDTNNINN